MPSETAKVSVGVTVDSHQWPQWTAFSFVFPQGLSTVVLRYFADRSESEKTVTAFADFDQASRYGCNL